MDGSIRIVIADDENSIRRLVRMAIAGADGLTLVGEACDGSEVLKLAEDLRPDVVLLDLNMPNLDGIGAAKQLREVHPSGRVVVLTAYDDESMRLEAFDCGVQCYLVKGNVSVAEVIAVIREVVLEMECPHTVHHRAIHWRDGERAA